MPQNPPSKLRLSGQRVDVHADHATSIATDIFMASGCPEKTATTITRHLVDTSLCGIESHGLMRIVQYHEQFRDGYMDPLAQPKVVENELGGRIVDGGGGSGILAMELAYETGMKMAKSSGISALGIRRVGHTGRHGAFADDAAAQGFLTLCIGGGNRHDWPQVAPYGGTKGILPTNPWCAGVPGGDQGPVVMDFATSKMAGGWIYAAKSAGADLPPGCVIDSEGNATQNPDDYFNGGAILPAGEQKGYALAMVAEMIAEAMLGPATTECHWLLITLDTTRFREPCAMQAAAEEVLAEVRSCPPAPGFNRVEIPGERERQCRDRADGIIAVPESTWDAILGLHDSL